jgi:hypothetical protein
VFYLEFMSLPLRALPLIVCTSCDENLAHCHGTALVSVDHNHVCSDDPECTLSVDEHWFVSFDED